MGEVRSGRATELPARRGEFAFCALAPFLGAAEAREEALVLGALGPRAEAPPRPWTLIDSGVGDRAATDTVARLAALRTAGDLRHRDLARAVGVSARTVSRWLAGESAPSHAAERRSAGALAALERVVAARPGRAAREWLLASNPHHGGKAPADLLGAGEHARVSSAL